MEQQENKSFSKTTILVAEDSPTQAIKLQHLLETNGYTVCLASNGKQALELAIGERPMLIVSDVVMPEMNGFEFCRSVRNDERLKDIPIILVTTLSDAQDIVLGLECGADNFVRKPYEEVYLLQRIQWLLTHRALRKSERVQMGIEIHLGEKRHFITAERQQMFDLLISTYEEAVHLNTRLERSNQSLNGLYRIAEGLNRCMLEEEVIDSVLTRVMELPAVAAGWIFLRNGDNGHFRVKTTRGLPRIIADVDFFEESCECQEKCLSGEMSNVLEVFECERIKKTDITLERSRYHASVPIWVKESQLGVMNLLGKDDVVFSDQELQVLHGVGHQVGLALERARLHQHLERLVEERTSELKDEVVDRKRAEVEARMLALRGQRLADLSKVLAETTSDYRHLVDLGAKNAVEMIGDNCIIALLSGDEQPTRLELHHYSTDETKEKLHQVLEVIENRMRDSRVRDFIEKNLPVLLPTTLPEDLWRFFETETGGIDLGDLDIHSLLAVPLRAQGRMLGLVTLFRNGDGYAYTEEDRTYLEQISGRVAQAILNAQMIDMLKGSEATLREKSDLLTHLISTSPTAILSYRVVDGELVPVWISENIWRITSWTVAEALQQDWWKKHLHEEDQSRVVSALDTVFSTGFFVQEYRFVTRDGTIVWIHDERRLLRDKAGAPVEIVASWTDISELRRAEIETKKIEQQLFHAQRLDSLGSLAGGIAHDLNNILQVVNGFSELLIEEAQGNSPMIAQLDEIRRAGEQGADIVKQILAFSRKQVLEVKPIDINRIVARFEKMIRRLIGEDIILETQLSPDLDPILADHVQIEQVLMNLAINARDAMPDGGMLTIETSAVTLDDSYAKTHIGAEAGWYIMLAVSDTGHGMSADIQNRIFEPFFTTKERGSGTGLGLATVYGIVKQHGGSIWVYSEIGRGTTFKVYFPFAPESVLEEEETKAKELARGTETILVVEDNSAVLELVSRSLSVHGYTVLQAASPREGLLIASELAEEIHLLMTDVIMPEMDGRELYTALKEVRPDIKVLFMSGYTDNVIVRHGVLEEGIHFLQKPFAVPNLLNKVREVLED